MDQKGAGRKLSAALDLFEFGVGMKRQQLRRANPDAAEDVIDELLATWMLRPRGAAIGDCSAPLSLRPS